MHSKVKREYLTESRKFDWRAKHRSFLWSPNSNLTKFQDPNFYRTLIYGMTTIGLESYSSASKALLSNYRKEGVFLLCIFRVQETVNRVSSRRLRLSHIFHLHRKLYSTNSISAGKIGMHGFFLLQGCYTAELSKAQNTTT